MERLQLTGREKFKVILAKDISFLQILSYQSERGYNSNIHISLLSFCYFQILSNASFISHKYHLSTFLLILV